MSFESDLKKMQKMWQAKKDNTQAIQDTQDAQAIIDSNAADIQPNDFDINSINDIGGDYMDIAVLMSTPYQVGGFNWTITKTLPEAWIPNIRIDVGYNFTGGNDAFENMPCYFNKVLTIVPSPTSSTIVTATWQVGLYFVSYDPTNVIPSFQAKLFFTLIDPSQAT